MKECKIKISNLLKYALAGRSYFMVQTSKGKYHYKMSYKNGSIWFIYGSENGDDFKYIGCIGANHLLYITPDKCEFKTGDLILGCLAYIWSLARAEKDDERILVYHDGICSKCGRQLTDEVSINLGLGPVCRGER